MAVCSSSFAPSFWCIYNFDILVLVDGGRDIENAKEWGCLVMGSRVVMFSRNDSLVLVVVYVEIVCLILYST